MDMTPPILPFTHKVLDELKKTMVSQDLFGIKKYGKPLDPMDSSNDWLQMAQEEFADGLKYFVAEKVRRDVIINQVLNDIEQLRGSIPDERIEGIKQKLYQLSPKK